VSHLKRQRFVADKQCTSPQKAATAAAQDRCNCNGRAFHAMPLAKSRFFYPAFSFRFFDY
jgi:hypothetical protein